MGMGMGMGAEMEMVGMMYWAEEEGGVGGYRGQAWDCKTSHSRVCHLRMIPQSGKVSRYVLMASNANGIFARDLATDAAKSF